MSIRLKAFIKESFQVIFGKADEQEFIVIAKRKVDEKTGLKVTQLSNLKETSPSKQIHGGITHTMHLPD